MSDELASAIQRLNGTHWDLLRTAAYVVFGSACFVLGYLVLKSLQPAWTVDHGMAWASGVLLLGGLWTLVLGLSRGYYHVQ